MAFRRSGVRIPSGPPATLLFAALWVAAAASLALRGFLEELVLAGFVAIVVVLGIVLTQALTSQPMPVERRQDRRTVAQALLLVAIVLFSCVRFGPPSLIYLTGWGYLPLWTYVLMVFVIPLVVVFALGEKPRGIGLTWGRRSFQVAGVWVGLRALMLAPAFVTGHILAVAGMMVLHVVGVAFPEELIFRGILQTRLCLLLGSTWAVVLSALLFGLWHLGVNDSAYGGDLATAAARSVLVQGTLGLGYSFAFARTRSLVAPSLAHAAFNAN
jgi:membrane protease YdiL (CAAX protease family)